MVSILTGFVAGLVHVITGPDHLAAIAPLAVKSPARTWVAGVRWGMGHSAGVMVVGLITFALKSSLPMDAISSWSERAVGVLLLGIGIWAIRSATRTRVHSHEHTHDGHRHAHFHIHGADAHVPQPIVRHSHGHAAFGIGTLHGLAGSSHFFGVLPALAFPSLAEAAGYLIAYALGTITAMGWFSMAVGWLTSRFAISGTRSYQGAVFATGLASIAIGLFWLWQG